MLFILLIVLVLSVFFLGLYQIYWWQGDGVQNGSRLMAVYVAICTLLLAGLLAYKVGFADMATQRSALRLEYRGVDAALPAAEGPRAFVRITGQDIGFDAPEKHAFRWYALPADAVVDVRPMLKADAVTGYRVEASGTGVPIRLNGIAVNRVVGGWVAAGDTVNYTLSAGRKSVSFGIEARKGSVRVVSPIDKDLDEVDVRRNLQLGELLTRAGAVHLRDAIRPLVDSRGRSLLRTAQIVRRGDGRSGLIARVLGDSRDASPIGLAWPLPREESSIVATASAKAYAPAVEAAEGANGYRLSCGLDTLQLPNRAPSGANGQPVLAVRFDPPRAYPVPPATVLQSCDFTLQLSTSPTGASDGYLLDTGNANYPVMTRVQLARDLRSLTFQAGGGAGKEAKLDSNVERAISDDAISPVVRLDDPFRQIGWTWLLPTFGLLAGGAALILGAIAGIGRLKEAPIERMSTAIVFWVGITTLLTVRGVLAFRASMLPPANMSTVAAESYRRAWPLSSMLLVVAPLVLALLASLAVRVMESRPRKKQANTASYERFYPIAAKACYTLAGAIAAIILVGHVLHNVFFPSSFLLFGVLLFTLGVVVDGILRWNPQETRAKAADPLKELWRANTFQIVSGGLLLLADLGATLYAIPFVYAIYVSSAYASVLRQKGKPERPSILSRWPMAIVGVLVVLPFLVGPISSLGATFVRVPLPSKDFTYRFLAGDLDRAQTLMRDPSTAGSRLSPDSLADAMHQRWQMETYVAGSGAGYFRAPLSDVGMSFSTLLSDASFDTLLVGEHGRIVGWLVAGFHLLVAMCLFLAAFNAAATKRQKANVQALYAFGGLFGFVALYMDLANLWLVPFTGQNVPLMAPSSISDPLLYLGLAVAAYLLMAFPGWDSGKEDRGAIRALPRIKLEWWLLPAALAFWWLVLGVGLAMKRSDPLTPFNFPEATYASLDGTLRKAQTQLPDEGAANLASTPAFRAAPSFFRSLAVKFDAGSVTGTPIRTDPGRTRAFSVDRSALRVASPFESNEGVAWRGLLLAHSGITEHRLSISGSDESYVLRRGAGSVAVSLGADGVPSTTKRVAECYNLVTSGGRGKSDQTNYGGVLISADGSARIRWNDVNKPARVTINGNRLDLSVNEYELKPLDVVTLKLRDEDSWSRDLSIRYLGPSDTVLARAIWRNGRFVRVFPQGSDLPVAWSIGNAADRLVVKGRKVPTEVKLSVDLPLQHSLQAALVSWSRAHSRAVEGGTPGAEGLPFTAVCVLDSHTGQIRGLASLPQCDPNDDLDKVVGRFDKESDAFIAARSSWAFQNRTIGSTIKPLSFVALAAGLNGPKFDIANLSVSESAAVRDGRYRQLDNVLLAHGVEANASPRGSVSMNDYLRDSRTWPAVVTASLGLVPDREALPKMLFAKPGNVVSYAGRGLQPNLRTGAEGLFMGDGRLSSPTLADTALFQSLTSCYAPNVFRFYDKRGSWPDATLKQFLPFDLTTLGTDGSCRYAVPEAHYADTTLLTDLDGQLVRYLIGGGECRWNAVVMAGNAARIATGLKVQPTLSDKAEESKEPMPGPVHEASWREAHVLRPLGEITTLEGADVLRASARAAGLRLVMKTGTIDDGTRGPSAKESEMLMFTIGPEGFPAGKTVSGFISIRSSKNERGERVKASLVRDLLPIVEKYLAKQER